MNTYEVSRLNFDKSSTYDEIISAEKLMIENNSLIFYKDNQISYSIADGYWNNIQLTYCDDSDKSLSQNELVHSLYESVNELREASKIEMIHSTSAISQGRVMAYNNVLELIKGYLKGISF